MMQCKGRTSLLPGESNAGPPTLLSSLMVDLAVLREERFSHLVILPGGTESISHVICFRFTIAFVERSSREKRGRRSRRVKVAREETVQGICLVFEDEANHLGDQRLKLIIIAGEGSVIEPILDHKCEPFICGHECDQKTMGRAWAGRHQEGPDQGQWQGRDVGLVHLALDASTCGEKLGENIVRVVTAEASAVVEDLLAHQLVNRAWKRICGALDDCVGDVALKGHIKSEGAVECEGVLRMPSLDDNDGDRQRGGGGDGIRSGEILDVSVDGDRQRAALIGQVLSSARCVELPFLDGVCEAMIDCWETSALRFQAELEGGLRGAFRDHVTFIPAPDAAIESGKHPNQDVGAASGISFHCVVAGPACSDFLVEIKVGHHQRGDLNDYPHQGDNVLESAVSTFASIVLFEKCTVGLPSADACAWGESLVSQIADVILFVICSI